MNIRPGHNNGDSNDDYLQPYDPEKDDPTFRGSDYKGDEYIEDDFIESKQNICPHAFVTLRLQWDASRNDVRSQHKILYQVTSNEDENQRQRLNQARDFLYSFCEAENTWRTHFVESDFILPPLSPQNLSMLSKKRKRTRSSADLEENTRTLISKYNGSKECLDMWTTFSSDLQKYSNQVGDTAKALRSTVQKTENDLEGCDQELLATQKRMEEIQKRMEKLQKQVTEEEEHAAEEEEIKRGLEDVVYSTEYNLKCEERVQDAYRADLEAQSSMIIEVLNPK